jgi:hypothetical protein
MQFLAAGKAFAVQNGVDIGRQYVGNAIALFPGRTEAIGIVAVASSRKNSSVQLRPPITLRRRPRNSQTQISQAGFDQRFRSSVLVAGSWMMPRLPVNRPRLGSATMSPSGVTRFCRGMPTHHRRYLPPCSGGW